MRPLSDRNLVVRPVLLADDPLGLDRQRLERWLIGRDATGELPVPDGVHATVCNANILLGENRTELDRAVDLGGLGGGGGLDGDGVLGHVHGRLLGVVWLYGYSIVATGTPV